MNAQHLNSVSSARVISAPGALVREDRAQRLREVSGYRARPEQKMAVMVPARELGAKVLWPSKFR